MEIAVINAGTASLTNKEIESNIQALAFTVTGATGGATTNRAILDAVLATTIINVLKQDSSNNESLMQNLNVADIAEICAHNDGVIKIDVVGGNATITFALEICNSASLRLGDSAKLMFNLSGIPATTAITVDSLDHADSTYAYIRYEPKFVNANVGKDFDINAAYALALPTASIDSVELTYLNGKVVKLSAREIKQVLTDGQNPLFNLDGKVQYGYGKFSVISVEMVTTVRVTLTASTSFYLLKNQTI